MPDWLADWLGVPATTDADGATWQLDSAWNWPPWATVLLVLAAIAFTVLLYARESSGAGRAYRALLVALRLAAIGLVVGDAGPMGSRAPADGPAGDRAGDRPFGQHGDRRSLHDVELAARSFVNGWLPTVSVSRPG